MDTKFLEQALKNWQDSHDDHRNFRDLTPAEQSEILRDAQDLKEKTPLSIDDVLEHKRHTSLASIAAAEAKELQELETMLRARDAAILRKYQVIPIPSITDPWRSL